MDLRRRFRTSYRGHTRTSLTSVFAAHISCPYINCAPRDSSQPEPKQASACRGGFSPRIRSVGLVGVNDGSSGQGEDLGAGHGEQT